MVHGGRLSLVIGSQCESLGPGRHLEPLSKAAAELDAALRDPQAGDCAAALPGGHSLQLDLGITALDTALVDAFAQAHEQRAALVLAYIGHGLRVDKEYYVLPHDAEENRAGHKPPYRLTSRIADLLSGCRDLRSLTLILDTCESGQGAANAAEWAVLNDEDMKRRFQVLTASSLESAYYCAFSLRTARILRDGHVRHGKDLRCADIKKALVEEDCLQHVPVCLGYDGGDGNADLWLAHNRAPANLRAELGDFEATAELGTVVATVEKQPLTVVRAPAGSGKTTLLAALTRPELDPGIPENFLQALHRLDPADDARRVATSLAGQLRASVPGFTEAYDEAAGNDAALSLAAALAGIPRETPVRIALDGLDQVRHELLPELRDLVNELLFQQDQELTGLRVLVSARPETELPWPNVAAVDLAATQDDVMRAYLERRGVREDAHDEIVRRSAGNWLVAALLADWLEDDRGVGDLPDGVDDTYTRRLRLIRGEESWKGSVLRAVLTVLAADVTDGIPEELLQHAVRKLHPRAGGEAVATALGRLPRLVVSRPLGEGERVHRLFHPTLTQYLMRPGHEHTVDVAAGHRAIGAALNRLAPKGRYSAGDPLYDYAVEAEATHLWEEGGARAVVQSLNNRVSPVPAVNLARWEAWWDRFERELEPSEPYVLVARGGVGTWTQQCGDEASARRIFEELVDECRDAFDPDHPDADALLDLRDQIASWFARDDPVRALHLCQELERDCKRALGPDHLLTLAVRNNVAAWAEAAGDPGTALRLWRQVVTDSARALGAGHPLNLVARNGVALGLAGTGAVTEAIADWGALLLDIERHLGGEDELAQRVRTNLFEALRPLV